MSVKEGFHFQFGFFYSSPETAFINIRGCLLDGMTLFANTALFNDEELASAGLVEVGSWRGLQVTVINNRCSKCEENVFELCEIGTVFVHIE